MLGTYIQKLRRQKKLTLSQLAEMTDISKSYLSHIERSIQTNPSIEVLKKIALALDVDIHTLLNSHIPAEEKSSSKLKVKDWNKFINMALHAGVLNEKDLLEISLAIQKGLMKP